MQILSTNAGEEGMDGKLEEFERTSRDFSKLVPKPLTSPQKYVIITGRPSRGWFFQNRTNEGTGVTSGEHATPAAWRKAGRKRGEAPEQLHKRKL